MSKNDKRFSDLEAYFSFHISTFIVMNQNLKYAVGIDVSMDNFHVCFSVIDALQKVTIKGSRSFTNNSKGFQALAIWVKAHQKDTSLPIVYAMEATGIYYENLAWFLHHLGHQVSVILPKKAKHYFKCLGLKSKNDKIDASGLAQMSAQQNLDTWEPLTPQIQELRALTRYYNTLQEQKTVFCNQVHAIEHSYYQDKTVLKNLKELIKLITKQIKSVRNNIAVTVENDTILKEKFALITPIQGVGLITVATIVSETNGFELFENERQLTSYSGYDVTERQSGKFVGQRRISKQGNARIRKVLCMPAFNVVRLQQKPFTTLFERVYQRTNLKMKGYVAVQRKILVLIFALWKRNEKYNPNKVASASEATLDEVQKELLLQQ